MRTRMCGRFANTSIEKLKEIYSASATESYDGSTNVAPNELAPIVLEKGRQRLIRLANFVTTMQARGSSFPLINLQSEKVHSREAFKDRRCIIPAIGFYEWQAVTPKDKRPHFFSPRHGLFSFAGLYSERGERLSFSILTTAANTTVGRFHGRMPVILGHNAAGAWLGGESTKDDLIDLLRPLPDDSMQEWEVSKAVNHAKNKAAECINSL